MLEDITSFLIENGPDFLYIAQGALLNLQYASVSVICGLFLGILLTICKLSHNKIIKFFANFYTSIFRGTPLLLQLNIIYFGLPSLLKLDLGIFSAGVIAFSLNSAAYVSEIIKAGIMSIDKGQFEAAQVLGISPYYAYKDIILPQAMRNILPALVNELVDMLKETSLISVLGGMDLMYRAQIVASQKYSYFIPMITASICYYIMISILNYCVGIVAHKVAI